MKKIVIGCIVTVSCGGLYLLNIGVETRGEVLTMKMGLVSGRLGKGVCVSLFMIIYRLYIKKPLTFSNPQNHLSQKNLPPSLLPPRSSPILLNHNSNLLPQAIPDP
jgi:hypothetical protein